MSVFVVSGTGSNTIWWEDSKRPNKFVTLPTRYATVEERKLMDRIMMKAATKKDMEELKNLLTTREDDNAS